MYQSSLSTNFSIDVQVNAQRRLVEVAISKLNPRVVDELLTLCRSLKQTDAVALVLKLRDVVIEPSSDRTGWSLRGQLLTSVIENSGIPVISVVAGRVSGEAAELAIASHYRLAEPGADISFTEAGAYFPRWGAFKRIAERLGRRAAITALLGGMSQALSVPVHQSASSEAHEAALADLIGRLAATDAGLRRLSLIAMAGNPLARDHHDILETTLYENLGQIPEQAIDFLQLVSLERNLMQSAVTSDLDDFGIDYVPFNQPSSYEKQDLARKSRIEEVTTIINQKEIPIRGRCIELGSGHGYFSVLLSRQPDVQEAVAVDLSAASILRWGPFIWNWLKPDWSKLRYVVRDMNKLSDSAGQYDSVIFCASLHHSSDIPQSMRIANQLLKPGGVVVLHGEHYDPYFFSAKKRRGDDVPHTIPEFEALLKSAGFEPKVLRYSLVGKRLPKLKKLLMTAWPFYYLNGWFKFANFIMCGVKK